MTRHVTETDPSSELTWEKGTTIMWAATSWQNQQNDLCAQQRLRSAWASAQSDHSLCCPHEETLGPQLPTECTTNTLIRLGGCPGWSVSSLGAQIILLVCHEAAHVCIVWFLILQTHRYSFSIRQGIWFHLNLPENSHIVFEQWKFWGD